MRTIALAAMLLPALLLAAPHSGADEPRAADDQDVADAPEKSAQDFKPPPGFRSRKRGEHTVYCRREEPKGTRFPTEVCYDEKGIREMLQAQREDQIKVDQVRRTQATTNTCCD
jgi:hypothetical protein